MTWQTLLKRCDGIAASDALLVAKILEYFPVNSALDESLANSASNSSPAQSAYSCLFATLLSLHMHQQQGNTCMALTKLANSSVFKTKIDAEHENEQDSKPGIELPSLDQLSYVLSQWLEGFAEQPPYVLANGRVFIQRYFEYESEIFEQLKTRNKALPVNINEKAKELFESLFPPSQGPNLQATAVANALQRQFMVLNGGPGTGKTHTVARFLIMMQCIAPHAKVKLVAPTGKAAQRLSESLKVAVSGLADNAIAAQYAKQIETTASTIHKTLGTRIGSTQTRQNQQRPLACDILVIDEFSMVDTAMFAKVLRACKANTRILLVGDAAQLPSVECGNLLGDLSQDAGDDLKREYIVTLLSNFRSNETVTALANAIQQQQTSIIKSTLGEAQIVDDAITESDYTAQQKEKLKPLLDAYIRTLMTATAPSELLNALKTFKILSPIRKGPHGVEQLNTFASEYVLAKSKTQSKQGLFHGQAIIISENDASTGLSNGDVGVLWYHKNEQQNKLLAYIERDNSPPLELSTNRLPNFETAFALTIHKTQGSEYHKVLIVLPYNSAQTCSRELLYTGVTRAKEDVQILARQTMLQECLNRSNRRDTYLGELLRGAL